MLIDQQYFESALKFDHLNNSVTPGSYNPGMRLLFGSRGGSFANNLVFNHEFNHALLSVNIYGCVVAFLKFISIDCLAYWALYDDELSFSNYWELANTLNQNISELNRSWIILHEGWATFSNWLYLQQSEHVEKWNYIKTLERVLLDKDTPYSRGFHLIDQWHYKFPYPLQIKQVLQQVANIDMITDLTPVFHRGFSINSYPISPDLLLAKLINCITQSKAPLIFDITNPANAREFLESCTNLPDLLIGFETNQIDILEKMLQQLQSISDIPPQYQYRIDSLLQQHREFEVWKISSWLFFPAEKYKTVNDTKTRISYDHHWWGFFDDFEKNIMQRLRNEIELLINIDYLNAKYLPDNPAIFRRYLANECQMLTKDYYFWLFGSLFPSTKEKINKEAYRISEIKRLSQKKSTTNKSN